MNITIDPEFSTLLMPLTEDEKAGLEQDISENGCRDALVLWNGILLDGHNRHEICTRLGLNFNTVNVNLPDRYSAHNWVIRNQLGKRNVTPEQASYLRGKRYEAEKTKGHGANSAYQNDTQWTRETLSDELKVSPATIQRDAKFSQAVDAIEDTLGTDAKNAILRRDTPITKKDVLVLAKLEPAIAGEVLDRLDSKKTVSQIVKELRREEMAGQILPEPSGVTLLEGDFIECMSSLQDNSVDLIFTDPPYDEVSVALYGQLAKEAARVLKPGASLLAYAGHYALPTILNGMGEHLRYWWTCAIEHSGASARLPGKWVFVGWKPLVWFVKEGRRDNEYVSDIFKSTQPNKDEHDWQQDTSEAEYYIDRLTKTGELVVDPFLGSGTTLVAAKRSGRNGWGCDIDPANINISKARLNEDPG